MAVEVALLMELLLLQVGQLLGLSVPLHLLVEQVEHLQAVTDKQVQVAVLLVMI
jgi:hypothetical protein